MTIERVGPLDHLSKIRKNEGQTKSKKSQKKDSVQFSDEARAKAELYKAVEVAKSAPTVRPDRIAEVKKKLEDPSYISKEKIEQVAEKIMESFGI